MVNYIISEDTKKEVDDLLKNSNIKFTNYQRELLEKFIERPDLILIETEYPIVSDVIIKLKMKEEKEFKETVTKFLKIIKGKVEECFPEKEDEYYGKE